MNKRELKRIYRELQEKMEELEAAIYSDTDSYTLNVDYDEVLTYYQNNDDDSEEGL